MLRKVLVTGLFKERHIKAFKQALNDEWTIVHIKDEKDEEAIKGELFDSEIVVGQPAMSILKDFEHNCPNLKFIQMAWAGADMYTKNAGNFPSDKVMLANASGAYGMIMSQFVIGMILSLMLNLQEYHAQQLNKVWERHGPVKSLEKAKVLIFGAGDIGTCVAKRLRGFDAYCIGVCRDLSKKRDYFDELCTLESAEKYIKDADVIVGCLPDSEDTEGYMNASRLHLMKKDSIIVNVGRGSFIDCRALDEVLKSGLIWGAGLDVTNPEPLPLNHPLWDNKRCIITPHASGATFNHLDETENLVCNIICDNLTRYCKGKPIRNRIVF